MVVYLHVFWEYLLVHEKKKKKKQDFSEAQDGKARKGEEKEKDRKEGRKEGKD